MKAKLNFDPMFQADMSRSRRRSPIRWIGIALVLLVLSGLALHAGPIPVPGRRPVVPLWQLAPISGVPGAGPWGAVNPRPFSQQRPDRFVIVAPAELDAAMVVPARADIDPEMVFHPEARRGGWASDGPAPTEIAPDLLPVPDPPDRPRNPREGR